MTWDRRRFVATSAALAAGATARALVKPHHGADLRKARSRVAILSVPEYSSNLEAMLLPALKEFNLNIAGKSVLLKPNLVEHIPKLPVNTHPKLVGAAASCFLRLGAARVVVGEGPGHERDTEKVVTEAGLVGELGDGSIQFSDLNRDELVRVKTAADYSGLGDLWLPRTVLQADLVVSLPKVKTHHWAGVTLSMKNMFGIIPGMKYGWPKNTLHWHGIYESILDICATVPISFVIADGVEAMEGNGPIQGESRRLGRIILADDPVAADATCSRLMGLYPNLIRHINQGGGFLGNLDENRIEMLGEAVPRNISPFRVLPEFRNLQINV
jgi:uncharacterized protein (DUF362 family)